MRDDVVELAVAVVDFGNARGDELDIGKLHRLDRSIALCDLHARQIDADELCARHLDRHRDDIAAGGTTQLEDAAGLQRR
jgi:hypothetical protein